MKIVVTGAAGFLGANLVRRLLADGHTVVGVDTFDSGLMKNIAELHSDPSVRFTLEAADVTGVLPMRRIIDESVDRVYHLACMASPPFYQAERIRTLFTCAEGTRNVLLSATKHMFNTRPTNARVLIASTSEVYGDPQVVPQPECYRGNVDSYGPRSCYDEGKRYAEAIAAAYEHEADADVRIARIFNSYGPYMRPDDGRVVSTFLSQALEGEPLTIHGDGTQVRSFCYVDDTIEGLVRLMESSVRGPVNIGNDHEYTMNRLAELVGEIVVGRPLEISWEPRPEQDPTRRCPDIRRAMRGLSWAPTVKLEDGLPRTAAWLAEVLGVDFPA